MEDAAIDPLRYNLCNSLAAIDIQAANPLGKRHHWQGHGLHIGGIDTQVTQTLKECNPMLVCGVGGVQGEHLRDEPGGSLGGVSDEKDISSVHWKPWECRLIRFSNINARALGRILFLAFGKPTLGGEFRFGEKIMQTFFQNSFSNQGNGLTHSMGGVNNPF